MIFVIGVSCLLVGLLLGRRYWTLYTFSEAGALDIRRHTEKYVKALRASTDKWSTLVEQAIADRDAWRTLALKLDEERLDFIEARRARFARELSRRPSPPALPTPCPTRSLLHDHQGRVPCHPGLPALLPQQGQGGHA